MCGKDLRDAASMTEDRTKWRQSEPLRSMLTMGPEEEIEEVTKRVTSSVYEKYLSSLVY